MSEITIYAEGMRVFGGRAWTVHAEDGRVEWHDLDIYDQRDIDAVRAAKRDIDAGRAIHGDCVRGGCQRLNAGRGGQPE
jgi:hypothetical protein